MHVIACAQIVDIFILKQTTLAASESLFVGTHARADRRFRISDIVPTRPHDRTTNFHSLLLLRYRIDH